MVAAPVAAPAQESVGVGQPGRNVSEVQASWGAGRVERLARILLDTFGTFTKARAHLGVLQRESVTVGAAQLWEAVGVQLNDWEHEATTNRGAY